MALNLFIIEDGVVQTIQKTPPLGPDKKILLSQQNCAFCTSPPFTIFTLTDAWGKEMIPLPQVNNLLILRQVRISGNTPEPSYF